MEPAIRSACCGKPPCCSGLHEDSGLRFQPHSQPQRQAQHQMTGLAARSRARAHECVPCPPGAHDVDEHFRTAPFEDNIPVLLGLTGVWNTTFLGYPSMAILPYTQALSKLAPHIQQVLAEELAEERPINFENCV